MKLKWSLQINNFINLNLLSMKKNVLSLVMLFLFGTMSVIAKTKTEEFKVYGNCGMCKNRIEKAAKAVEGVTKADWDSETKMIKVTYDDAKTDADKIQLAIANIGHDTKEHKADDKVYDKLHGCCKYDRPDAKEGEEKHDGHDHHKDHDHN